MFNSHLSGIFPFFGRVVSDDLRTFPDDPITTGPLVCQFGASARFNIGHLFFNPRGLRAWQLAEEHRLALERQAEEHHRDCKPAPFPRDDSSGDRGALCQEYNRAPHACTSLETYTPEALICDLVSDIVSVPRSTSVSVEHQHQTTTSNHEELARTTYT